MKSENRTEEPTTARRRSYPIYSLLTLISPILLTVSWALALKATMAGNWAKRENYSSDFPAVDTGPLHRSPFTSCGSVFGNQTVNGTVVEKWYESCTRYAKPGASCDASATGFDYPALCQQINLAARLLVVNCVFGGLAFAGSWILCAYSVLVGGSKEHRRHHHNEESNAHEGRAAHAYPSRYEPSTPLYLFALIAAVAAFLAAVVGGNALVNLSSPTGDFTSSTTAAEGKDAAWSFDKGYNYASASWILAAFGAWSVNWVWGRGK
ncbi:hypothetical protein N431DRAFT_227002 [Stipitochalara longipes BDJ]|nr:hypothetical protein N431DRAFT_227002 [Stipitochalara longipes BDJ]